MRLSLHRRLLICVLFLLSTLFLRAQESQTFLLHFRFDSAQIDSTFKNNSKDIQGILNLVTRPDAKIDSIEIKGWSSPDGGLPRNITLSRERAESIKNFILANISPLPISNNLLSFLNSLFNSHISLSFS